MVKILAILLLLTALSACQNQSPNNEQTLAQENPSDQTKPAIPTHSALKNQAITFQREVGNYPILIEKDYQAVNDDIAKLIQGLVEFDKQFDKNAVSGGVDWLEYELLTPNDNELAILINYAVTDMTARSFRKYYQLDLKTKQQVLLKDYLDTHQIHKINESLNQFLDNCRNSQMQTKQCDDISLGYLSNFYHFDNQKLDIINDNDGFYILDKDHIIIAFNSSKFTTSFKVNIKTYQISL